MASKSGLSDIIGLNDADELALSGIPLTQVFEHENAHLRCTNWRFSSHQLKNDVRAIMLETEVERLKAERDILTKQISHLETDVEVLKEEVATLKKSVKAKDDQRQQIINQYEQAIREKNSAHQEVVEELNATATTGGNWPTSLVRSLLQSVLKQLKQ